MKYYVAEIKFVETNPTSRYIVRSWDKETYEILNTETKYIKNKQDFYYFNIVTEITEMNKENK